MPRTADDMGLPPADFAERWDAHAQKRDAEALRTLAKELGVGTLYVVEHVRGLEARLKRLEASRASS
jgi:hypothetical protein